MGSGDVRCGNGYPLVANQLETPLSFAFQRDACLADCDCGLRSHSRYISVCYG